MRSSLFLVVSLILGCGLAFAQSGGLAGVTMRVVDDLSGIDAVVLELEVAPAENTEDADDADAAEEQESEDTGRRELVGADGAERPVPQQPPA
jgi:hypothetical protein